LHLIVPATADTRHSLSARLFAQSLSKVLGQPVEVVNPDCSSATCYAIIAEASPDGYTIGYTTMDLAILHWRGLTKIKPADLTPIALLNEDPAAVHVRADSPWQTARQLLEHIRSKPGKLKASSTPTGGIWHLSTVGWLSSHGIDAKALPWVSDTGPGPAIQDMLLGASDVLVCRLPFVRFTPQAKHVRALAVMASSPISRFSDVPTMQQATGIPYAAGAWRGLVGPKSLPPATASLLVAAARKAWEQAEFQEALRRRGFVPAWSADREFARYMETASSKMGSSLRTAGLVPASGHSA
jgi:tripartite-type tricarboxylate transporter receptor subunit TctC